MNQNQREISNDTDGYPHKAAAEIAIATVHKGLEDDREGKVSFLLLLPVFSRVRAGRAGLILSWSRGSDGSVGFGLVV